ncbi:MipA/OmpV family protein [Sulfidibacter corallicola]|uniref:MipA/OmpV family protein n=1 Tax=Sulfidibacter corallicola TaxID=2818388 RepID=A0A8A4TQ26_SULCO|nr:MipA/OmpV family protein [Sulfidibacter corallicola]QTD48665.1 MipA/OmpV family protein [Sulfidibacter corallicola]
MTFRSTFQGVVLVCVVAFVPLATFAGDGEDKKSVKGYLALGAAAVPDFEGSEDYEAVPFVAAKVDFGKLYIETRGLGARANLSPFDQIEFGPALSFRNSRDDDVENELVAGLREVDSAFEAGAFVKVPFNGLLSKRDQLAFDLEVVTDVSDTHDGTLATLGVSYSYAPTMKFRLSGSLQATYADDSYMETYFAIDADNASRSGWSIYEAEGGVKDLGFSLAANYQFNAKWGLVGIAGYKKLLDDAADSPIVLEAGDENQYTFGLGLSYRF